MVLLATVVTAAIALGAGCAARMTDREGMEASPPPQDLFGGDPINLIRRSLDAYGEADLVDRVESLRLQNRITMYGGEVKEDRSVEYYRFPNQSRIDVISDTEVFTFLYDGVDGWQIAKGLRSRSPDMITEGLRRGIKHIPILLLRSALDDRSILGPVLPDSLDGRVALRVDLTDREGDQSRLWFDTETLLIARLDYTFIGSRGGIPVRVMMGEYRAFDGVQTATLVQFYQHEALSQETQVDEATYNPTLPDSIFAPRAFEEPEEPREPAFPPGE